MAEILQRSSPCLWAPSTGGTDSEPGGRRSPRGSCAVVGHAEERVWCPEHGQADGLEPNLVKGPQKLLTARNRPARPAADGKIRHQRRTSRAVLLNGLPDEYAMIRTVLEQTQALRFYRSAPQALLVEAPVF